MIDWRTVEPDDDELHDFIVERFIQSHAPGMTFTDVDAATAVKEITNTIHNIQVDSVMLDLIFNDESNAVGFRYHESKTELRYGMLKDMKRNPYVEGRDD